MLKIRLTVLRGGTEGSRFRATTSPFVIGRATGCDLMLASRSVSRQHSVMVFDQTRVVIQDLGSRNHTIIRSPEHGGPEHGGPEQGGPEHDERREVVLNKGQACRLWHYDELQIGKLVFRISIRDAMTAKAVIRLDGDSASQTASPSQIALLSPIGSVDGSGNDSPSLNRNDALNVQQDLLQELDSLVDPQTMQRILESATGHRQSDGSSSDLTIEAIDPPDAEPTAAAPSSEEISDSSSNPVAGGPQKLPDHLRPKGPVDSQDAASEALRRMFSGGR